MGPYKEPQKGKKDAQDELGYPVARHPACVAGACPPASAPGHPFSP